MNGSSSYSRGPREKEQERPPFFLLGNEILDVFQPIIGPHCFTTYSHLARRVFKNPELKHSVRDLARASRLGPSTVSHSLEVLAHLGLVKLVRRGGSQESECELLNSWEAAKRLGAEYLKKSLSWSLPPDVELRLEKEVKAIRARQQGKKAQAVRRDTLQTGGKPSLGVSQRNAGVSPEARQRATRETQTGTHLLQEEVRNEEVPTPTPTPTENSAAPKDKDSPDEDEPDELLKFARRAFIGVIDEMRAHLLDTNRPPSPQLANGYADWEEFGFGSLAVERAAQRGEGLALVLSASDPAAAREGLKKYHRTWEPSLRTWYRRKVEWEIQETKQTWWNAHREEPEPGG